MLLVGERTTEPTITYLSHRVTFEHEPVLLCPPLDKEKHYDALADLVRNSLDMKAVYRILDEGVGA